jgi:hypothetical protein
VALPPEGGQAKLIARAPDLYDALANMIEAGKRTPHGSMLAAAMRHARIVLAQARGEDAATALPAPDKPEGETP